MYTSYFCIFRFLQNAQIDNLFIYLSVFNACFLCYTI